MKKTYKQKIKNLNKQSCKRIINHFTNNEILEEYLAQKKLVILIMSMTLINYKWLIIFFLF